MDVKPHLFIKLDKYKNFLKKLDAVNDKVGRVESILEHLEMLKIEEDGQLQKWRESVEKLKGNLHEAKETLK